MGYSIVVVLGLLCGSFINAYVNFDQRNEPVHKWYLELYYKGIKNIAVEIIIVVVFVFLYKTYGFSLGYVKYAFMTLVLATAGMEDMKNKTISNRLIIVGMIAGVMLTLANIAIPPLINAALGLVLAGGVFGLLYLISKGGIGFGDVKLFACAGIFLGFEKTITTMIVATVLSGLVGLILIISRISSRKSMIPFAPFIFLSSVLTVLWI